ncbi:MAG TPA: aminopeptidase [Candidatus Binataceae bacterium]
MRPVVPLIALALCAISLCGCDISYLAHGTCSEIRLLWNRKPIEQVLQKKDLQPELRSNLELVLEVRRFAADNLGLNVGGAYKAVTQVDKSAVTWVLMAAEPDQLTPYTWYFPIVGSVPYKGYFKRASAQAAAASMEADGLDTFIRPAVAFSSLGYFNDPLLSNLLGLNNVVLTGVIIHELFHRTYFLASNVMFDESAANYVGGRGAVAFFDHLKGPNSEDSAAARAVVQSDMKFGDFLNQEENKLLALYSSRKPRAEILKQRTVLFNQIQADYTKLKSHLSGVDRFDLDQVKLNNAVLINYQLYFHNLQDFAAIDALHQCDLRATIETIIDLAKGDPDNPFEAIHKAAQSAAHRPLPDCVNGPASAPLEAKQSRH